MARFENLLRKKFKRYEERFNREKENIERALGMRKEITLTVEMPAACKGMEKDFKDLPNDPEFMNELKDFISDYLERKHRKEHGDNSHV